VLLTADPGAPTPDAVVNFDYGSAAPAPLTAFDTVRPLQVRHFSPIRARGPFAEALRAQPDSVRARLERIVLVDIEPVRVEALRLALAQDRYVSGVHVMPLPVPMVSPRTQPVPTAGTTSIGPMAKSIGTQEHRAMLRIDQTWNAQNLGAEGWAHVAIVDNGLDTGHPELRSVTGTSPALIEGGNWIPSYSYDFGSFGPDGWDPNVDEAEPVPVAAGTPCASPEGGSWVWRTGIAGHGTHIAGVIGANASDAVGVSGTCRHCGIMMFKMSHLGCTGTFVRPFRSMPSLTLGQQGAADVGAQVISVSSHPDVDGEPMWPMACDVGTPGYFSHPYCLALQLAELNDVVTVGASGNQRNAIILPGSYKGVTSSGGVFSSGLFWDERPSLPIGDPCTLDPAIAFECGSNYTYGGFPEPQDHVALARNVLSTVYRGLQWSAGLRCGDDVYPIEPPAAPGAPPPPPGNLDGFPNDGYGHCTGTSFSAPQVAGVFGILRSINPLVRIGDPFNTIGDYGVRDVMAETASGPVWDNRIGFGIPNAEAAARRMLGSVRPGQTVPNRVTPMFTMYSSGMTDVASTPSPQFAMSLRRFTDSYSSVGPPSVPLSPLVSNYLAFPGEDYFPGSGPRANFYILTTARRPRETDPPLVPLYHLDRVVTSPPGCDPVINQAACPTIERDFMTVTTKADADAALAQGYAYVGRQGYVYAPCEAKGCEPAGTLPLYRRCRVESTPVVPNHRDCALFLADQDSAYHAAGYQWSFPPNTSPLIGYAYPAVDKDGDGLIDGMEYVIGTNPAKVDSDADGISDGIEFPMIGVSQSYACGSTPNSCN
jgi:subtilisin family serine protease